MAEEPSVTLQESPPLKLLTIQMRYVLKCLFSGKLVGKHNFTFVLRFIKEEAYLQEAIKNSLQETRRQTEQGEKPSVSEAGQSLLLDFLEEEQAPAPQAASHP
jgi:hypothetical protein